MTRQAHPRMESIATIFERVAKDIGLERGGKIHSIRMEWSNLVGKTIAIHTYPEALRGDMLVLTVETPQWMHHLTFYKDEIRKKLKEFDIKRVTLRLGKLPDTCNAMTNKDKERLLTEDDRRYIDDALKDINDRELKDRLKRLLMHGLIRGRRLD